GGGRPGRRFGGASPRSGRRGMGAQVQGRWSLTSSIFGEPVVSAGAGAAKSPVQDGLTGEAQAVDPRERRRALAELLLERYGVLTREQVLAEGIPGGFASVYGALGELETLGVCRRGYFVEGLGGAQFALPGAVERLRSGRSSEEGRTSILAAVDPAQPLGAALPWPRREDRKRRPGRVAGAYVVFVDARPVLYLERGGRGILTLDSGEASLREPPLREPSLRESSLRSPLLVALRALADAVRAGRVATIALERVDGEPAIGSSLEPALVELGFRQGPRRLTLRA
ncbi:MAG: hypothetical protein WBV85_11595, partial [Solirubrobacteraceae bacterium]